MTVVVKQYGERRTGTNTIRGLIHANYPDVLLLMYILGDKHAVPVDFATMRREAADAFAFVHRATYAARGPASHDGDREQHREIGRRAERVAAAYDAAALRFVVTVKDPYAWVASLAKFEQWSHGDAPLASWDFERLEAACRGYNEKYAAWVKLERAHFVKAEELIEDQERVVRALGDFFGANQPSRGGPTTISDVVEPTHWDHLPLNRAPVPFDASYYREKRYLSLLPAEHRKRVTRTIDWSLFARFGYQQES